MIRHDETLQVQAPGHDGQQVGRRSARLVAGPVIRHDHAAHGKPGERLGGRQGSFQMIAADIVEIDVEPTGGGGRDRGGEVRDGPAIDRVVDADLAQVGALLGFARRADYRRAIELGDLARCRPDGPGGPQTRRSSRPPRSG